MPVFTPIPVPSLTEWEAAMLPWWQANKAGVNPANGLTEDNRLLNTYYDAWWCFLQIRDFRPISERAYWEEAAGYAEITYRDRYVIANNALLPTNWSFARGLYEDFIRTGDVTSKLWAINMSKFVAYAPDTTNLAESIPQDYSREVAYNLMDYIIAERLGEARRAKYLAFKDQIFGHMHQWFIAQDATFYRPFMWSLSAHTLIEFAVDNPTFKQAIIDILVIGADFTWDHLWVPAAQAFQYTDRATSTGGTETAADLNNLISPIYAWLYYQTGQDRFRARFDAIFVGGIPHYNSTYTGHISGSYLGSSATAAGVLGKHINQNTRLIFQGLFWRQQTPLPLVTPTGGDGGGDGGGGTTDGGGGTDPGGSGTDPIPAEVRSILLPIKNETYEDHFLSRGWASPQDQIDAGYAVYIQPGNISAIYEETIDLEATVTEGTVVSVFYSPELIDGTVNVTTTISVSPNNVAYRDYPDAEQVFEKDFRYVRVRMVAEATDSHGIMRIPEVRLKVAAKEKRDGGNGTVTDAVNGAVITFNKPFNDIDSIQVTPENVNALGYGVGGYYIFSDVANPTSFTAILKRQDTGVNVTGKFSWSVKGT